MIERIKALLEKKNKCLEEFALLNEKQIDDLRSRKMIFVEEFYKERELILKNIKEVDKEVDKELKAYSEEMDPHSVFSQQEAKREIESLIRKREAIVRNILKQDMEILDRIDLDKCSLIGDLKEWDVLFQEKDEQEDQGQDQDRKKVPQVAHLKKS